ncbi:MAG: DNA repair protein RadA [Thermoleophilaceae bacterium]|nr:DNA repair protein RadA [Thermoleophilaceae bacterium]
MASTKTPTSIFVCNECGTVERKWHGQCPGCQSWNTLIEEAAPSPSVGKGARRGIGGTVDPAAAGSSGLAAVPAAVPASRGPRGPVVEPVILSEVRAARIRRIPTGIGEFDRVLGGSDAAGTGLVPGSLVLLGGAPGIGKSTLVGAALGNLVANRTAVLYVSGEESPEQIRVRHERLGAAAMGVPVIAETDLDSVIATIEAQSPKPEVCVIDSVQTLYCADLSGAPGSVGQVREVASRLMQVAKSRDIAMLLVGHVTKEGSLAGPRVLEHLVDCVLHFEGERDRTFRTLRAEKNRFGSTNEVGVFEMKEHGLVEVLDASARFVGDATNNPGSVIFAAMEGTRPMLIEIQALVSRAESDPPRRVVNGIDRNRLSLILAVLGRHAGVSLSGHDVFVNVVGGVRIDEPGADLAVALAVASSARGVELAAGMAADGRAVPLVCFGEVGLTGELRPVTQSDRRVAEAVKFGLTHTLFPVAKGDPSGAHSVREALARAFGQD